MKAFYCKVFSAFVFFLVVRGGAGIAYAQEAELAYDNGNPAGAIESLLPGDIEAVRMTPAHPAEVTAVSLYFAAAGCTAAVRIWKDNGGNSPETERILFQTEVSVDATGWLTIQVPEGMVVLDPPAHFHVGHEALDPVCNVAWDDSGTDEIRSMVRMDGAWFFIGDDQGQGLNALIRSTVSYFNVVTQKHFRNVTEEAGLSEGMNRVAWGDYNNSGFDDLLVNGNRLFRNNGDGTFTEVTEEAGIGGRSTNGGVWADFNNDGHLDFYATVNNYLPSCEDDSDCVWCRLETTPQGGYTCGEYVHDHTCEENRCMGPSGVRRHNILWRNNGDGTFTDVSEEAGRPYDFLPTEAAAWGDYDNDGFVDLYVANYETPAGWASGALGVGNKDFLWRNNGDGTFTDVSEEAGLRDLPPQCGRGVTWIDHDESGFADIYVTNYRLNFNFFWRNRGDGTFENISGRNNTAGELVGSAYGHSIGATWADVNRNGHWDLFVANLAHPRFIEFSDKSMLYLSSGPPDYGFTDHRESAGITFCETHSDPSFVDYNNNGFEDLFITAIYKGFSSFLYQNTGDAVFEDVTYKSGIRIDNGWGGAWADYNNNGKPDLVSRTLWENRTVNMNHWLKVRLRGVVSNRAAIGAVVEVVAGDHRMKRQVSGGRGTGNQDSLTLHFGLGSRDRADVVTVRWPSGIVDSYENISSNQTVTWWEGGETADGDAGVADDAETGDATRPDSGGCG